MEETFYVDANIFLLGALEAGELGEKAGNFLQLAIDKKWKIYTSALTFDEFAYKVLKSKNKEDAVKAITSFFSIPNLTILDANKTTTWLAFNLIKQYSLDPRDAIHAASAMQSRIRAFVSEDKDFDKVKELKRMNLKGVKS